MQKIFQLRSDPQNWQNFFTVKQKQCTVYQVHNKKLVTSLECTKLSEYASTYIDSVTGNHEIFSGNEGKKVKL